MKVKVWIYTLASDTNREGTSDEVFGTEAELLEAQKRVIEDSLGPDGKNEDGPIADIRRDLRAGEIYAAWITWEDEIRDPMDTYSVGKEEVVVELPEPFADLLAAGQAMIDGWERNLTEPMNQLSSAVEEVNAMIEAEKPA